MAGQLAARLDDQVGAHSGGSGSGFRILGSALKFAAIGAVAAGLVVAAVAAAPVLIAGATAGAAIGAAAGGLATFGGAAAVIGGALSGASQGIHSQREEESKGSVGGGCSKIGEGSPNVVVEGKAAARAKADKNLHGSGTVLKQGSATVYVNGKPFTRKDDCSCCGGKVITSASRTYVGGPPSEAPASGTDATSAGGGLDAVNWDAWESGLGIAGLVLGIGAIGSGAVNVVRGAGGLRAAFTTVKGLSQVGTFGAEIGGGFAAGEGLHRGGDALGGAIAGTQGAVTGALIGEGLANAFSVSGAARAVRGRFGRAPAAPHANAPHTTSAPHEAAAPHVAEARPAPRPPTPHAAAPGPHAPPPHAPAEHGPKPPACPSCSKSSRFEVLEAKRKSDAAMTPSEIKEWRQLNFKRLDAKKTLTPTELREWAAMKAQEPKAKKPAEERAKPKTPPADRDRLTPERRATFEERKARLEALSKRTTDDPMGAERDARALVREMGLGINDAKEVNVASTGSINRRAAAMRAEDPSLSEADSIRAAAHEYDAKGMYGFDPKSNSVVLPREFTISERAPDLSNPAERALAQKHARAVVEEATHALNYNTGEPGQFVPLHENVREFSDFVDTPAGKQWLQERGLQIDTRNGVPEKMPHEIDIMELHQRNSDFSQAEVDRYDIRKAFQQWKAERPTSPAEITDAQSFFDGASFTPKVAKGASSGNYSKGVLGSALGSDSHAIPYEQVAAFGERGMLDNAVLDHVTSYDGTKVPRLRVPTEYAEKRLAGRGPEDRWTRRAEDLPEADREAVRRTLANRDGNAVEQGYFEFIRNPDGSINHARFVKDEAFFRQHAPKEPTPTGTDTHGTKASGSSGPRASAGRHGADGAEPSGCPGCAKSAPPPAGDVADAAAAKLSTVPPAAEPPAPAAARSAPPTLPPATVKVLRDHGLTMDSKVYRVMDPQYLDMNAKTVAGNPKSMARIADVYGPAIPNPRHQMLVDALQKGEITQAMFDDLSKLLPATIPPHANASAIGPGLNVAAKDPSGYAEPGMVKIGITVRDLVNANAKFYPDVGAVAALIKPLYVTFDGAVPFTIEK